MQGLADTWKTAPKPAEANFWEAYLVQIYPTGHGIGSRHAVGDFPLLVGRDDECGVRLLDPSVSRRHARIQLSPEGHLVEDLQSTNGTRVNHQQTLSATLKDGDYVQFGNLIFRYLRDGNIETKYHEEINRLAIVDPLTGIYNRKFLLESLDRELSRTLATQRPLTLILFDLDRLKTVNDTLGHLAGDAALCQVVQLVQTAIRKEDVLARYGGEEFAILLPESTSENGFELAERVRQRIAAHTFTYAELTFFVTVSLGLSSTEGQKAWTSTELIQIADFNLYQAKKGGRNCTRGRCAPSP